MKLLAPVISSLLFALSTTLAVAAEPVAMFKPDLDKGQALAGAVCIACHTFDGTRGNSANPILQGQHPEYLAKQLAEFKEGKRENAVMKVFASALSEEDMKNIGYFYYSKTAAPGEARNKDSIALGEKIYRGGVADRKIPSCSGCHGPAGKGVPSQYPRLAGQHAEYTETQLIAYRSGTRKNNAQMLGVAAKLNDAEIKALSDYIAGLR